MATLSLSLEHPAVDVNCDRMLSFQPLQLLRITKTITASAAAAATEDDTQKKPLTAQSHKQCFIYTDYFCETAARQMRASSAQSYGPERIAQR